MSEARSSHDYLSNTALAATRSSSPRLPMLLRMAQGFIDARLKAWARCTEVLEHVSIKANGRQDFRGRFLRSPTTTDDRGAQHLLAPRRIVRISGPCRNSLRRLQGSSALHRVQPFAARSHAFR